jgi:hypothetical protein
VSCGIAGWEKRVLLNQVLRPGVRRLIGPFVATVLLAAPAVVLANHQFPDVASSNPFHGDIDAIVEAGITAGFGDGGFHPSDPVTRQAMAAFLHRGFGRVGLEMGEPADNPSISVASSASTSNYVQVRQLTITVPGVPNSFSPQQLIHLQGHVEFVTGMGTNVGCPCEFGARIRDFTTNAVSNPQSQTIESTSANTLRYSFDVEALFAAPAGSRTFLLEVALSSRVSTASGAVFAFGSMTSLSAMTFPFGPNGTNAL